MDKIKKAPINFSTSDVSRKMALKIALLLIFILMLLPFWTIAQDILTRAVMRIGWYKSIQNIIVPYELRIVGSVLKFSRIPISVGDSYMSWERSDGKDEVIYLIWNCVGWQTFILFGLTLITGLSGKYSWRSKLEALVIGVLGTYLVNIFRLIIIILVYMGVGRSFGTVFHDYFSSIASIVWLFLYWWFVFKYVLEDKATMKENNAPKSTS